MTIKNITSKKILSRSAREAKSIKDKTLGLIFDDKTKSLVITTRFGIHTHLMDSPIDILILDKNHKVVKIKESLKPNRIFIWNPKFSRVIELPKGTVRKTKTKIGDRIGF